MLTSLDLTRSQCLWTLVSNSKISSGLISAVANILEPPRVVERLRGRMATVTIRVLILDLSPWLRYSTCPWYINQAGHEPTCHQRTGAQPSYPNTNLSSHPILKRVRLANPHHILLTIGETSVKDSEVSDNVTAQRHRLVTVTHGPS